MSGVKALLSFAWATVKTALGITGKEHFAEQAQERTGALVVAKREESAAGAVLDTASEELKKAKAGHSAASSVHADAKGKVGTTALEKAAFQAAAELGDPPVQGRSVVGQPVVTAAASVATGHSASPPGGGFSKGAAEASKLSTAVFGKSGPSVPGDK